MSDLLTDRDFWLHYWETQTGIDQPIPDKLLLYPGFDKVVADNPNIKTAIELGGFPGTYSVYLKQQYGLDTALLDYVVHEGVMEKFLKANKLNAGDIKTYEADLFNHNITDQYDLVYSVGLIEHFKNTKEILEKHLDFLAPGGVLFIFVPNFLGVNGWIQKNFDRPLYDIHYLDCMYPENLKKVAGELGLVDIEADYYGGFSVWLEDKEKKSALLKAGVKSIWFTGKVASKILPMGGKSFAPYTYLVARKQ